MKIMGRKWKDKHFHRILTRSSKTTKDYPKLRFRFLKVPGPRKKNNKMVLEIHAFAERGNSPEWKHQYAEVIITLTARDLQRLGPQLVWFFPKKSNRQPAVELQRPSTHHNTVKRTLL